MSALPSRWRERAANFRLYADEGRARVAEELANELEGTLREEGLEALDLNAAEIESGYTQSHLKRLMRDGKIPNSGTDDDPEILRMHLPRKPGYGVARPHRESASSRTQVASAIASGRE